MIFIIRVGNSASKLSSDFLNFYVKADFLCYENNFSGFHLSQKFLEGLFFLV